MASYQRLFSVVFLRLYILLYIVDPTQFLAPYITLLRLVGRILYRRITWNNTTIYGKNFGASVRQEIRADEMSSEIQSILYHYAIRNTLSLSPTTEYYRNDKCSNFAIIVFLLLYGTEYMRFTFRHLHRL
jgi:hypothetical protein